MKSENCVYAFANYLLNNGATWIHMYASYDFDDWYLCKYVGVSAVLTLVMY